MCTSDPLDIFYELISWLAIRYQRSLARWLTGFLGRLLEKEKRKMLKEFLVNNLLYGLIFFFWDVKEKWTYGCFFFPFLSITIHKGFTFILIIFLGCLYFLESYLGFILVLSLFTRNRVSGVVRWLSPMNRQVVFFSFWSLTAI